MLKSRISSIFHDATAIFVTFLPCKKNYVQVYLSYEFKQFLLFWMFAKVFYTSRNDWIQEIS